jgi:hypothetical protein
MKRASVRFPLRAALAVTLLAGVSAIALGALAPSSGAATATPTYSATGVCVNGVSQFLFTFDNLPQTGPTTVTLSIYDDPDAEANGTPVIVGPGVTSVLWNIPSPLFHAGMHVIAVHIGSTGISATNLTAVPDWPVSSSFAITLPQCGPTLSSFIGIAQTPDDLGYWQTTSDGQVLGFGDARTYGSMSGTHLNRPIVGMTSTPDGGGYWLVASDGGVFSFGDAQFYGSTGGMALNMPIVGMASTIDGHGYYLVASDGGVFSFGDATFQGSMGATHLNKPVVGMSVDPSTGGYWLVASDGGIFSFGAAFLGSTGGLRLNRPIVGMSAQSGTGYRLVASDGGVFTFGTSLFFGSLGLAPPTAPVEGIVATSTDYGYTMIGSNGAVYRFGFAGNFGSIVNATVVN